MTYYDVGSTKKANIFKDGFGPKPCRLIPSESGYSSLRNGTEKVGKLDQEWKQENIWNTGDCRQAQKDFLFEQHLWMWPFNRESQHDNINDDMVSRKFDYRQNGINLRFFRPIPSKSEMSFNSKIKRNLIFPSIFSIRFFYSQIISSGYHWHLDDSGEHIFALVQISQLWQLYPLKCYLAIKCSNGTAQYLNTISAVTLRVRITTCSRDELWCEASLSNAKLRSHVPW